MLYAIDRGIEVFDTDPMAVGTRQPLAPGVRYQRALAGQLASTEVRVGSGSGGPADTDVDGLTKSIRFDPYAVSDGRSPCSTQSSTSPSC
jgi:hypothetical protein